MHPDLREQIAAALREFSAAERRLHRPMPALAASGAAKTHAFPLSNCRRAFDPQRSCMSEIDIGNCGAPYSIRRI